MGKYNPMVEFTESHIRNLEGDIIHSTTFASFPYPPPPPDWIPVGHTNLSNLAAHFDSTIARPRFLDYNSDGSDGESDGGNDWWNKESVSKEICSQRLKSRKKQKAERCLRFKNRKRKRLNERKMKLKAAEIRKKEKTKTMKRSMSRLRKSVLNRRDLC